MIVRRFLFGHEFDVPAATEGVPLPDFFLLAPGNYVINGAAWDMSGEGYYIYYNPLAGTFLRRLVTNANALAFCSAFSWAAAHGSADASKTHAQLDAAAKCAKLRLPCGALHPWIKQWASAAGFQCRVVRLLTAETPDGYNDGHVALEIRHPNGAGPWVLADCTLGQYHVAADTPLSLRDLIPRMPSGDFTTRQLSDDAGCEVSPPVSGTDVTSIYELLLRTPALRQQWARRIYQIPGIDHSDGLTYFYLPLGTASRQSWVLGLSGSFRVVSKAAWDAMFYGG